MQRKRFRRIVANRPALPITVAIGVILLASCTVGLVGWYVVIASQMKPPEEMIAAASGGSTQVTDRNGNLLYEFPDPYGAIRRPVPLSQISPNLIAATIATEDPSFYDNPGINFTGLAAAIRSNLPSPIGEGFGNGRGGSSITQQLVKNLYLSPDERLDRRVTRKAKETVLALELKRRYSDDQILEWYLNLIYYGNSAYGAEAAAQRYFGKPAKDLTLGEAAMLAGVANAPALYSPVISGNEERSLERQHEVLRLMLEHQENIRGIVDLTPQMVADALQETLAYQPTAFTINAPHFVFYVQDFVTRMCQKDLFEPPGDIDCEKAVSSGGLHITTSLDLNLQHTAEQTVEQTVAANEEQYGGHNGALVAIRPESGEILAMVGSRDYFRDDIAGNVNIATAPRSHGSTMKVFTYLTAFEKGWVPASVVKDAPLVLDGHRISNWNFAYAGDITVRKAVAESVNTAAVRTVMDVGEEGVVKTAHNLGITDLNSNDCGPTITLGACDVKLVDMTYAYSVLANNGTMRGMRATEDLPSGYRELDPASVLRIQDSAGKVLYEFKPESEDVLKPAFAYMLTDILSKDAIKWSGLTLDRPAASKTGTSEEFRDNVVLGYTPDLAVGVWLGNADGTPMAQGTFSRAGAGPLWKQFMISAHQLLGLPPREFQVPGDVTFNQCGSSTEVFAKDVPVTKPTICDQKRNDSGSGPPGRQKKHGH